MASGVVAAVSGGPDSMYLLAELVRLKVPGVVVAHVNHGARGKESDRDQALVEATARKHGLDVEVLKTDVSPRRPGFEARARNVRRDFLARLADASGGRVVATAHTADDQVETVLMRFLEGAGISGLKGIPREAGGGAVRPILDLWKKDIVALLKRRGIAYRLDRSNRDTRYERNWVRHVLIPLLERRYGSSVKKRIFATGERFRELDDYLAAQAARWIRRNVRMEGTAPDGAVVFARRRYAGLPTALRVKVLQTIFLERLGLLPNERLLRGVDGTLCAGGPSAERAVGRGWRLRNRYEAARFVPGGGAGGWLQGAVRAESVGKVTPARARRIAAGGDAEVFDAARLRLPLAVRALRPGDRIRPFGMEAEKKMKQILIDRKVPREARWGRPAVCDAEGAILWVPGVIRSAHAPVTASTRCAKIIRYLPKREETSPFEPVL